MAFITGRGLNCYKVMLFGLKNATATYQRLVNKVFEALIRTSIEVYVDDIITKSVQDDKQPADLQETFQILY